MTRIVFVAAVAICAAVACGKDSATNPAGPNLVVGSWALMLFDGAPLPKTLSGSGTSRTDLVSSKLVFDATGHFSAQDYVTGPVNGVPGILNYQEETGTYTVRSGGARIRFDKNGLTATVTVRSDTLLLYVEPAVCGCSLDYVSTYVRQSP